MGHTTVLPMAISVVVILMMLGQLADATPAIRPLSQRGIIFPKENYDECFVDVHRTLRGTCKKLADCPTAVERWEHEKLRPQTCYFIKFEHVVCCEKDELADHDQSKEATTYLSVTTTKSTTTKPTTTSTTSKTTTTTTPLKHDTYVKRSSEVACETYVEAKANKYEDIFDTTVVYDKVTKPNEYSYMSALGWRSKHDTNIIYFHCGGALISPRFVLTAAHCVKLGGEAPTLVRVGGVNLTEQYQLDTDYEIKRTILHPAYNVSIVNNDIALVELAEAVDQYSPTCLWTKPKLTHEDVTAVGYGQTRLDGLPSLQLLKVPFSVFSNDGCEAFFETPTELTLIRETVAGIGGDSKSTHICVGDAANLRYTCQGDAGGPLIVQTPYHFIVGVTAVGFGCAGGSPSIYTRIAAYIEWLEDIVWPVKVTTLTVTSPEPPTTTTPLLDVRVDV